jgi:hypothetical protein
MSSIRKEQAAMHKAQLKEEELRNNGYQPIIHEYANIDIDKIAKEADKEANEVLAKVIKESKPEAKTVSKPKSVVKTKAKVDHKK